MEKTMQYSADAELCELQDDGNNGHGEGNKYSSGGNEQDTRYYSRICPRFLRVKSEGC